MAWGGFGMRHVERHRVRAGPGRGHDFVLERLQQRAPPCDDHGLHPFLGQHLRHLSPDADATPRNDGHAAAQLEIHGCSPSIFMAPL
jgi:hypothetical protein